MIPNQFDTVRLVGQETVYLPILNAGINTAYFVKYIDGLGAPEFDVVLTKNQDARTAFSARHTQGRQLIFRIVLNPNYASGQKPRDLRSPFYGLVTPEFNSKGPLVEVIFSKEGVDQFRTSGYVKNLEIAPFNKEPELQLTMICTDPYLHATSLYSHDTFSSTSPMTITNYGSAPTGFLAKFNIIANTQTFDLLSGQVGWGPHLRLDAGTETFLAGDEIHIDTNPESRFVGHMRSSSYLQTYEVVKTETSGWPILVGGDNTLSWEVGSDKFTWISLEYVPKYWGI